MRTTSSLESLNAQINKSFGVKHPNIFDFMLNLRGFEYHKSREILEMANEENPKKVNTRVRPASRPVIRLNHDDLLQYVKHNSVIF